MKYRICDNCGKGFLETIVEIGYDDKVFCSKDCLIKYLYKKIDNLEKYIEFIHWLMKG